MINIRNSYFQNMKEMIKQLQLKWLKDTNLRNGLKRLCGDI